MEDKYAVLQRVWGYTAFRPLQERIVDSLLSGRDVLAVMPTGYGKSLCFQLPALLLPGTTVVVSPLIALMNDQVAGLRKKHVACACLSSTQSPEEMRQTLYRAGEGAYKLLYVSPERLQTASFRAAVRRLEAGRGISAVIVDEAHCVSMWGVGFRPEYRQIADFMATLAVRPVLAAFTATATAETAADISLTLGLRSPMCVKTSFDRPNLYFAVDRCEVKPRELLELLQEREGQCGIVYCSTRREAEYVSELLGKNGMHAPAYHGGLAREERLAVEKEFIGGKARVIAATNAFGMGIDKSDVRFVIHYSMPLSLENYYQEAGRAGRDGKLSECILLFAEKDVALSNRLLDYSVTQSGLQGRDAEQLRAIGQQRLDAMLAYCRGGRCLRKHIMIYFGEKRKRPCIFCGECAKLPALGMLVPIRRLIRKLKK